LPKVLYKTWHWPVLGIQLEAIQRGAYVVAHSSMHAKSEFVGGANSYQGAEPKIPVPCCTQKTLPLEVVTVPPGQLETGAGLAVVTTVEVSVVVVVVSAVVSVVVVVVSWMMLTLMSVDVGAVAVTKMVEGFTLM
jgi:hypothetical protein